MDSGLPYVQLPSRAVFAWHAIDDAKKAWTPMRRHISRAISLIRRTRDMEMREYDLERLSWFVEEVERWAALLREEIDHLRGPDLTRRRRIELLRNNTGRTPEEAAAFNAKADQLEREVD
jgi:hypothetical protein